MNFFYNLEAWCESLLHASAAAELFARLSSDTLVLYQFTCSFYQDSLAILFYQNLYSSDIQGTSQHFRPQ